MSDVKKEPLTVGKKIGTFAFIVSQVLVVFVIIAVIINIFFEKKINSELITNLLLFQGATFGIVWGAKATSNFAPINKKQEPEKKDEIAG